MLFSSLSYVCSCFGLIIGQSVDFSVISALLVLSYDLTFYYNFYLL